MTSNPGRRISAFEVAGIFAAAYNRSASLQKAVAGFEFCGLWPYNPNRFTDDDFTPSMVIDEPMAVQSADVAVATTSDDPAAIVLVTSENVHGQLNNSSAFPSIAGCGVSLLTDDHDNVDNVGTTTQQHEVTADQLPTTDHVTDALEENLSPFPTSEDIMLQSADDVDGMLNITESETEIELTTDLSRPTDEVNGHRQNSSSDIT